MAESAVMMPGCGMSSMAPAGHGWLGAALSFSGMWLAMMVPMMLPALVPMLRRYRSAARGEGGSRLDRLTVFAGAGYFLVWAGAGLVLYPLTIVLQAVEVERPALARAVPVVAGAAVLVAGLLQLTAWKARRLACCREAPAILRADSGSALGHGIRLGIRCGQCCGNLMAILLALGMMDLRVMTAVTAAITAERLAPAGDRVARAIGIGVIIAGAILIVRRSGPSL